MTFAHALRAASRLASAGFGLVVALALVIPLAFGAAMSPFAEALGGGPEHACACGMKPGTCGCPECARLLRGDLAPLALTTTSTLGSCDTHGLAPLGSPLPVGVLPAPLRVAPSPCLGIVPAVSVVTRVPSESDAPPTPPPRQALA